MSTHPSLHFTRLQGIATAYLGGSADAATSAGAGALAQGQGSFANSFVTALGTAFAFDCRALSDFNVSACVWYTTPTRGSSGVGWGNACTHRLPLLGRFRQEVTMQAALWAGVPPHPLHCMHAK